MIGSAILVFLLFCLPLVVLPFGVSYFETPKVLIAQFCIQLLLIVFIVSHNFKDEVLKLDRRTLWCLGILFCLSLGQVIFFWKSDAFFGNMFRLQGVLLLWHLMIFALTSGDIKLNSKVWLVAILALLGHVYSVWHYGVNINQRVIGSMGEPNALAGVIVCLLPFLYLGVGLKSNIFKWIVGILAALVGGWIIILTGSRSGMIGFLVEIGFILGVYLIGAKKAFLVGMVVVLASLVTPFFGEKLVFENRAEIWQTAWHSGASSPLFGHGFGRVTEALKEASKTLDNNVQYQFVDSSHNLWLDFWVQGGLLGLLAFGGVVGLSVYRLVLHQEKLMLCLFLGVLTSLMFNPLSACVLLTFWWVLGRGVRVDSSGEKRIP